MNIKESNRAVYRTDAADNRGFTLVELIVVMVILTLLAAILVPSLLGWIDEAKGKQYILSARSVYMSAQAIESEKYAVWDGTMAGADHSLTDYDKERILRMADAEDAQIMDVSFESDSLSEEGAASNHGYYTINGIVVQYGSITVTLKDGMWTVIQ